MLEPGFVAEGGRFNSTLGNTRRRFARTPVREADKFDTFGVGDRCNHLRRVSPHAIKLIAFGEEGICRSLWSFVFI